MLDLSHGSVNATLGMDRYTFVERRACECGYCCCRGWTGPVGFSRRCRPPSPCRSLSLTAVAVSYPPDRPLGYDGLLPLVEFAAAAAPGDFVVVRESFSGPLALMLAARRPPGRAGHEGFS